MELYTAWTLVWSFNTYTPGGGGFTEIPSTLSPALSADGSSLFVGADDSVSGHRTFYSLAAATGAIQWAQIFPVSALAIPAVANGFVYMATYNDGTVYTLDPATGATKWKNPACGLCVHGHLQ